MSPESSAHRNLKAIEHHLEQLGARYFTDEEIDAQDEVWVDRVAKSENLRFERLLRLEAEATTHVRGKRK